MMTLTDCNNCLVIDLDDPVPERQEFETDEEKQNALQKEEMRARYTGSPLSHTLLLDHHMYWYRWLGCYVSKN
jgi:hypothetical protein